MHGEIWVLVTREQVYSAGEGQMENPAAVARAAWSSSKVRNNSAPISHASPQPTTLVRDRLSRRDAEAQREGLCRVAAEGAGTLEIKEFADAFHPSPSAAGNNAFTIQPLRPCASARDLLDSNDPRRVLRISGIFERDPPRCVRVRSSLFQRPQKVD